jgi:FMN phosphatase YigB (HAD superfamily)
VSGVIEAVTFDHWNTLVREEVGALRDHRLDKWLGILEGFGFAVERKRLDAAFASSWERFVESWHSGDRQYTAIEAAVDIIEELGFELPPGVHEELVDTFSSTDGRSLHLVEGAEECLSALKGAGVRLGIVCDVGMTPSSALRENLERHGVLSYFDHMSFSDEVGAYKPSPLIFRHALAGLGVEDPSRAAHIGDLRRTDVAGAKGMGMVSVRFTGVFDDTGERSDEASLPVLGTPPEADHVISDLRKLPDVLGVAAA